MSSMTTTVMYVRTETAPARGGVVHLTGHSTEELLAAIAALPFWREDERAQFKIGDEFDLEVLLMEVILPMMELEEGLDEYWRALTSRLPVGWQEAYERDRADAVLFEKDMEGDEPDVAAELEAFDARFVATYESLGVAATRVRDKKIEAVLEMQRAAVDVTKATNQVQEEWNGVVRTAEKVNNERALVDAELDAVCHLGEDL